MSTLRGYSVTMTLVDMAWGTLATAVGGGLPYTLVVVRACEP